MPPQRSSEQQPQHSITSSFARFSGTSYDELMKRALIAITLSLFATAVSTAAQSGQPGALSNQTPQLQSEVLISSLGTPDLTREVTADNGQIEHTSEVARGGPVAAVVRSRGCQKDAVGICQVNADVVVYRPDGSVFREVKSLDLPKGRAAVPLTFDAQATTGVYRVVVTVRDLSARRFAKVERQFGVK
jgi:hypothetical protein